MPAEKNATFHLEYLSWVMECAWRTPKKRSKLQTITYTHTHTERTTSTRYERMCASDRETTKSSKKTMVAFERLKIQFRSKQLTSKFATSRYMPSIWWSLFWWLLFVLFALSLPLFFRWTFLCVGVTRKKWRKQKQAGKKSLYAFGTKVRIWLPHLHSLNFTIIHFFALWLLFLFAVFTIWSVSLCESDLWAAVVIVAVAAVVIFPPWVELQQYMQTE